MKTAGVFSAIPRRCPHPARLILTLSLAPTVGLGIGRFAYALVLPDMRDTLVWSYSAAGFMNTINAAGYLVGALLASRMIARFGLVASVRWGTLAASCRWRCARLREISTS
jgi:predicted MFS family arabinose efflux permease